MDGWMDGEIDSPLSLFATVVVLAFSFVFVTVMILLYDVVVVWLGTCWEREHFDTNLQHFFAIEWTRRFGKT